MEEYSVIDKTTSSASKYLIQDTKINRDKELQKDHKTQELLEDKQPSKKKLSEVIEAMNNFVQPTHTSLKFELHEESKEYYVKVIDDKTKEVLREIPSKKMLDMHAEMTKFLGILFDKKI